jgi:hypothetical protein
MGLGGRVQGGEAMSKVEFICSGLGLEPCPKRQNCARYVHWTVEPRSLFNACQPGTSDKYPHYLPSGTVPATNMPQGDLFAVPT